MPKMSPSEHAALWAQKFGGSAERYKAGIARTQGNPAQKAIAAQDRLLSNFTESVTSGRWANALSKVSEASWKQAATEKGAPALATAARVAQEKVARAESIMGPIRDSIVSSLPARGGIEENLERARQMAMKMHDARKRG
jgi:hypothetical protein